MAQNLVARNFAVDSIGRRDRYWAGDITYIWTREGWLYLAVVLDLFSRRVLGWSMSETMASMLVIAAHRVAVSRRGSHVELVGLIMHDDRGVQYASNAFQAELARHGVINSMSRKGDCFDNAVVESFNATIKTELIHHVEWETRASARSAVYEYLEVWYIQTRLDSTLGYLSPIEFEALHSAA